jgi:hypothetical protein
MRSIKALVLLVLLVSSAFAGNSLPGLSGVYDILPDDGSTAPAPLAAGASYTTRWLPIVGTTVRGVSWHLVPNSGNASVNIIILQANDSSDTAAQWSSPVDGTSVTTNQTLTTADGGSSIKISPSALVKFQVTNTAATTVTATLRGYARP